MDFDISCYVFFFFFWFWNICLPTLCVFFKGAHTNVESRRNTPQKEITEGHSLTPMYKEILRFERVRFRSA